MKKKYTFMVLFFFLSTSISYADTSINSMEMTRYQFARYKMETLKTQNPQQYLQLASDFERIQRKRSTGNTILYTGLITGGLITSMGVATILNADNTEDPSDEAGIGVIASGVGLGVMGLFGVISSLVYPTQQDYDKFR
ncbi:MAG: hypothetical protein KDD46_07500 [Bdellovibrionales bacterium]|nr:hypothetical protein [Bdellovibrionales bacterium]